MKGIKSTCLDVRVKRQASLWIRKQPRSLRWVGVCVGVEVGVGLV